MGREQLCQQKTHFYDRHCWLQYYLARWVISPIKCIKYQQYFDQTVNDMRPGYLFRLERLVFPLGTKHRRIVRRLLGREESKCTKPLDENVLGKFAAFQAARRGERCVVILAAVRFLEDEGQTTYHYAQQLAARGYNVIYLYHRWLGHEPQEQIALEQNIFLLPLDLAQRSPDWMSIFDRASSLFITTFPAPETHQWMGSAKALRWRTVYLSLDDWEGFSKVGAVHWYSRSFEEFVISNMGSVVAINDHLRKHLEKMGAQSVSVVPNGLKEGIEVIREQFSLRRGEITLGVFGYLEPGWFDWDLLVQLADRNPTWMIYVIGFPDTQPEVVPANLKYLGRIAQKRLASFARHWDVGLVPFKIGSIAEGADPIKVYEYLAMGLPVVMQGVMPPKGSDGLVVRADGAVAFELAVREAAGLQGDEDRKKRREFAYQCTWSGRVGDFLQAISTRVDPLLPAVKAAARHRQKWLFAYPYATHGGVETVLRARCNALQNEGIEAHIWFIDDYGGMTILSEIKDRCYLGSVDEFKSHLQRQQYDLVSVIDWQPLLAAAISKRACMRRLVLEFHTPYPESQTYLYDLQPGDVDQIWVPSLYQQGVCRRIVGNAFSVAVVPNAIFPLFFERGFQEGASEDDAAWEGPVIAWVGRLDWLKNWRGFLQMAEQILKHRSDVRFCMVATGVESDEKAFAEHLAKSSMARFVHRYRRLGHDDMIELYDLVRRSGGVVCSTSHIESFGMVIAEGMARGCAAVVPADSAMTDFVFDHETGRHFPQRRYDLAADIVIELLQSDVERSRLGDNGRLYVTRHFTEEATLAQLLRAAGGAFPGKTGSGAVAKSKEPPAQPAPWTTPLAHHDHPTRGDDRP